MIISLTLGTIPQQAFNLQQLFSKPAGNLLRYPKLLCFNPLFLISFKFCLPWQSGGMNGSGVPLLEQIGSTLLNGSQAAGLCPVVVADFR